MHHHRAKRTERVTTTHECARNVITIFLACVIVVGPCASSVAQDAAPVESLLERRHRNTVIQRWDLSCGAAALATILNYQHGLSVTEREIAIGMMSREEYLENPSIVNFRRGFSLLDLKRFVDARGFNGIGLGQLGFDDLEEFVPIIVPISVHGYQHFVVFRGSLGNRVLVADPAFGNRTMARSRFEDSWLALPSLGHVGFYVERTDGLIPPNRLESLSADFLTIR